jgi:hypothetical protein
MKTNFISFPTPSLNSIIGFLSILSITACGSYQNSSYYDTDGIYGTTEAGMRKRAIAKESAIAYQNYFGALQDTKDTTTVFTDIDSYSSYSNTENENDQSSYPSWGSNSQDININYYPNNWGLSFGLGYQNYGFGWRNPYYGAYFPYNYWYDPYMIGWGYNNFYGFNYYPNYFWGYQNNYQYHGSYDKGTSYSHNSSRRGSNYNTVNPSGSQIGRREIQNSSSTYSTRSSYNRTNSAPTFSRNSNNFQNQNYTNNNIGRSREYTSGNSNVTPVRSSTRNNHSTRSYTPSNNDSYNTPRSMDTNSSNSGGRSSDGGGRRGGR